MKSTLGFCALAVIPLLALAAGCSSPAADDAASESAATGAKSPITLVYAASSTLRGPNETRLVIDTTDESDIREDRKIVTVHYRGADEAEKWYDAEAFRMGAPANGHQRWFVSGLPLHATKGEFALFYDSGKKTSWNNNDRNNFKPNALGSDRKVAVMDAQIGRFESLNSPSVENMLTVYALTPSGTSGAEVSVTDNLSSAPTKGAFTGPLGDLDTSNPKAPAEWKISVPLPDDSKEVKFTVSLKDGGKVSIDDNFGKSFVCRKADASWKCEGDEILVFDPNTGRWSPSIATP